MDKKLVQSQHTYYRSICSEVIYKKVFLKISQNLQENTYVGLYFLIKLQVIKKETPAQVFSCEFCEIFKNTQFTQKHLHWSLFWTKF